MNHVLHLNRILAESIEFDPSGCWIYKGQQSRDGYGKVWIDGRRVFTHRFIYELLRGPLPDGLQIDHLCRVKLCCNPLHLEPVTLQENRRRAAEAIIECKSGHAYTPENIYRRPDGRRACRKCRLEAGRRYASNRARA